MDPLQLSPQGIIRALASNDEPLTLQVLNFKDQPMFICNKEVFFSDISDGYLKIKCCWTEEAYHHINKQREHFNNAIVSITQYLSSTIHFLISDFQIVYRYSEPIGTPFHWKNHEKVVSKSSNKIDISKIVQQERPPPIPTTMEKGQKLQQPPPLSVDILPSYTLSPKTSKPEVEGSLSSVTIGDSSEFQSIEEIYPGMENWVIQCTVNRINYKQFINKKRQLTKILEVQLVDQHCWSMRSVSYGELASKLSKLIKEGATYQIREGKIVSNTYNPKESPKWNPAILTLVEGSVLKVVSNGPIAQNKQFYRTIEDLKDLKMGSDVTLAGILRKIDPDVEVITKVKNEKMKKRTLYLCDPERKIEIDVIMWRDKTQIDAELVGKAVVLDSFVVQHYQEKVSLSSCFKSKIYRLKDHPLAEFQKQPIVYSYPSLSYKKGGDAPIEEIRSIKDLIKQLQGLAQKRHVSSTFRVYINNIKDTPNKWYFGCPQEFCRKEVDAESTACKFCENTFVKPTLRYSLVVEICDFLGTGSIQTIAYDSFATLIFRRAEDCSASEAAQKSRQQFEGVCRRARFNEFKVCIHSILDNEQVKHQVSRIIPIDHAQEARDNLAAIKSRLV